MGKLRENAEGSACGVQSKRRWLLSVACSALLATLAPVRARGATETELEGAAYAGQTTGRWTCGPPGEAHYAGIGGQMRISERTASATRGRGGTLVVGATVERERVTVAPEGDSSGHSGPLNAVQVGAGARVGNDWRLFGFQLGLQTWSAWGHYDDHQLTPYVLPQLELRAGPQDVMWLTAGFGSPVATTYRRPGAYIGAGMKAQQHEFNASLGSFRSGAGPFDDNATRFDLVWKFPAWHGWGPRIGGSLSAPQNSSNVDWEASLGFAAHL